MTMAINHDPVSILAAGYVRRGMAYTQAYQRALDDLQDSAVANPISRRAAELIDQGVGYLAAHSRALDEYAASRMEVSK
jgi:hypothetical protein